jgi:hypothetical protein
MSSAIATANPRWCAMLRTKTAYYRDADGRRIIDPDSTTACYTCIRTLKPYGPDDMPADARRCGADRVCFEEEA